METKRGLLDVMSECMILLSPEMNIRHFDNLRYIDAIFQVINFMSRLLPQLSPSIQTDLEKQLRICMEVYLAKIPDVVQLLAILDFLMSSIQEEILA